MAVQNSMSLAKTIIEENMQMADFWIVASCSLVEVNRRFRGASCFHHQDDHSTLRSTDSKNAFY